MGRKAKPLSDQIDLLIKRGMIVRDREKARQILLEIGFYRMSFYWFPFELRYPDNLDPNHKFRDGTDFDDALRLYAFDFNMRNSLLRPLERIETAFRTYMIYQVSTRYPQSPTWFADSKVVQPHQAEGFERAIYIPMKRQNPEIRLHHQRFPRDRFAPAWKTLEFMTLGSICTLYCSLLSSNLKREIASHFGVGSIETFECYIEVIRDLRNACAHGNILYSFRPDEILRGPAMHGKSIPQRNLAGALAVVEHFLRVISNRLLNEFKEEIDHLLSEFSITPATRHVLSKISGF